MNNGSYHYNVRGRDADPLSSYSYHGQDYSSRYNAGRRGQHRQGDALNYTDHVRGLSNYSYHRGGNRTYTPYASHGLDISGHSLNGSMHSYANNSLAYSNHGRKQRRPRKHDELSDFSGHSVSSMCSESSKPFLHNYKKPVMPAKKEYLALDCEMVATGTSSCCARVVLVDWKGRIILDEYTKPRQEVTDYRTFVSGITPEDLVDAPAFEQVREKVKELLEGKILVGHALTNDLKCLELEHPWQMIRDTACYEPFMKNHFGVLLPRKLKELSKEKLQREIQVDGNAHSPVEDAVAALDLYKSHRPRWEACILNQMKEGQKILNIQQSMPEENYQDFYAGLPIPVYP